MILRQFVDHQERRRGRKSPECGQSAPCSVMWGSMCHRLLWELKCKIFCENERIFYWLVVQMGLLMNKLVVLTPPGQPEKAVSFSWFPHTTPVLLLTIFY